MLLVWGSHLEEHCIWAVLSPGLFQMTLFHFLRRGRRRKLREHKCSLSSTVHVYGLYILKKIHMYIFCQSIVDLQCLRCTVRWFQVCIYTYIIFEIIFHHFDFSLSCIGEGNGNPLQCSCLENPRDGRAWWAAVCGVTQSRTRLKWLSSSTGYYKILSIVPCVKVLVA